MKGISPIVATVLLIALVITVSGILGNWIFNFTKSSTKDIKKEAGEQMACTKAEISLSNLKYCNNRLSGIMDNKGTVDIGNLTLQIIYQNTSQEKIILNDTSGNSLVLNARGLQGFNVSVNSNYDLIIFITNCTGKIYNIERNQITVC